MKELIKHARQVKKHPFRKLKHAHFFFKFKYPKLMLLALSIIAAYIVFTHPILSQYVLAMHSLGYLGLFGIGILFSWGFTTPFAVGFFLSINPENIFLASVIAGLGAFTADMLIFKIIKFSFMDEFDKLKKEKPFVMMTYGIKEHIGPKLNNYLLFFLAGFIIASPLPDEIGITMLAGLTEIKPWGLALTSLFFNFLGIYIMLLIGAA